MTRLGWLAAAVMLLTGAHGAVREVDLRVASPSAGPAGVVVRLAVPDHGRYGPQAPVVVHIPGGWDSGSVNPVMSPLAALGFVEVRFEFPRGDRADARGPNATRALAEVIAFASGDARDTGGRSLAELAAPLQPLGRQVGLVGWSNGGNSAVLAVAQHERLCQGVAWIATWESPVGDGAPTALGGDHRHGPNPAYDATTGAMDWGGLAYDAQLNVPLMTGLGPRGAFYFDLDHSGGHTARDHVPAALGAPPVAGRVRYVYPLSLLTEAARRGLPAGAWPAHLLAAEEAGPFWSDRNAAGHFQRAVLHRPKLLAMVLGTVTDHVQAAADHPHVWAAYDGWRQAKAFWVRLNPDAAYLTAVVGPAAEPFEETPANLTLTRKYLAQQMVPELAARDAQLVAAAAAELADRTYDGHAGADLDQPLHPVGLLPTFGPRG